MDIVFRMLVILGEESQGKGMGRHFIYRLIVNVLAIRLGGDLQICITL